MFIKNNQFVCELAWLRQELQILLFFKITSSTHEPKHTTLTTIDDITYIIFQDLRFMVMAHKIFTCVLFALTQESTNDRMLKASHELQTTQTLRSIL